MRAPALQDKVSDRLWTIEDVADFCRVKVSVVRHWQYTAGIPYTKLGRAVRFDPVEVKTWVNSHKCGGSQGVSDEELRNIT
jgi:predicted DNA-binding transcriptional regulator AlpA